MLLIAVGLALTPAARDTIADARLMAERGTVFVGRIVVLGNAVTAERVILNQLAFRSGQPFEYALMTRGGDNLARTALFAQPPEVWCVPREDDEQTFDILVHVKETQTRTVTLHVGLSSTSK